MVLIARWLTVSTTVLVTVLVHLLDYVFATMAGPVWIAP